MKKVLTFCASLAFLLGISGGANAFIVADFTNDATGISPFSGTIPVPGSKISGESPSGTFTDHLIFDVATTANLLSATLASPGGFLGGAAATVTLFQEDGTMSGNDPPTADLLGFTPVVASFAVVLGQDVYTIIAQLSGIPTRYFVEVAATTSGTGSYSLQLTTSIVPLPPAAVLFLSALAGLAGFSRIRRRKAVAT